MPFVRRVAVALLPVLFSLEALAADGAAAQAERLLELTRADRMTVPVYAQVQQMFAERAGAAGRGAQQAVLESYQARANALLDGAVGWAQLKPELIKLYTDAFSEEELRQLVAFYDSPLGRKMLDQLPVLNMRSAQAAQARVERVAPKVNALADEMAAKLQSTP